MNPILDVWHALPARDFPELSPPATWGPAAADHLYREDRAQLAPLSAETPRPRSVCVLPVLSMPDKSHIILAGDIGGTKTNLAIFTVIGDTLTIVRNERFPSSSYPGLNAILREFLTGEKRHILAACFWRPRSGKTRPSQTD